MEKKIAVLIGLEGQLISSEEDGIIKCFIKVDHEWKIEKEMPFCVDKSLGLKAVRHQIDDIAQSIFPCKIMVASKINGIFYTALDRLGFGIWELEGKPLNVLDKVWEDAVCKAEEESKLVDFETAVLPSPVAVKGDRGKYFFNLMEALKTKGNHTSKKVLKPFFKKGDFDQIEIICDHIPPWFHVELGGFGLEMEVISRPEHYSVIVKKIEAN